MLLGNLGVRLLGNMLADKGKIRGDDGVIQSGDKMISAGHNF